MKKVFLIFAATLMLGLPLRAQQCDTITTLPWVNDFATDYDCWTTVGSASWNLVVSSSGAVSIVADHIAGGTAQRIIASPAVTLPADSTGLRLHWKMKRRYSGSARYMVLVTTASRDSLAGYDTLVNAFCSNSGNLAPYSLSLADYAGQTVSIAFCLPLQGSQSRGLEIGDVAIYSDRMAIGTLSGPDYCVVGDSATFTLSLSQGDTTGLAYSWHSLLTGATGSDSTFFIVHTAAGSDTLSVTVSNAYGTITYRKPITVYACPTISTFPWTEGFVQNGSYSACWVVDRYSHSNGSYFTCNDEDGNSLTVHNYLSAFSGGYLITPTIQLPANATNLSLVLTYRNCGMEVRVGPTSATDTALFNNVIFHEEPSGNRLKVRKIPLASFAGQTLRMALVRFGSGATSYVVSVGIDYDTLPKLHALTVPAKVPTGEAVLCTAPLRYGSTDSLHYTWHSALGGTFTTNAVGDSAWVTYAVGDMPDSITVTVSNRYGSDTLTNALYVIDCTPAVALPWLENFYDGSLCWYKPAGSNWHDAIPNQYSTDGERALISLCTGDTMDQWVVSKAIDIPTDTNEGVILEWNVATNMTDTAYQPYYDVLVSIDSDRTNLAAYQLLQTDSTGISAAGSMWINKSHRIASLAAYAGHTIYLAFRNHPVNYGSNSVTLVVDNVLVRSTAVPVIRFEAPQSVESYDTVVYECNQTEGRPCSYTWHSTLLDTTVVITDSHFHVFYTLGGTDTITVTATNAYGSATDTAVVYVADCAPLATPWMELFSSVAGTRFSVAGSLPDCWHSSWNGTNSAFAPHVINYHQNTSINAYVSDNQALYLDAGFSSDGYDSVIVVESPVIAGGLSNKWLSFYYMQESATNGTLSVGYMHDSTFVSLATMPQQTTGRTVRIFLDSLPAYAERLAFQWRVPSWWCVIIDSVQLISFDSVPVVHIATSAAGGDSILFHANLTNGVASSLTYAWHSTMVASGQASMTAFGDSAYIVYTALGTDTVSVVATNAYGTDTARVVYTFMGSPVAVISGPSAVYSDDTVTYTAVLTNGSHTGLSYSWQSAMVDAGNAMLTSAGDSMRIVYLSGGTDTLTLTATNAFGTNTTTSTVDVTGCHINTFPWHEGFENGLGDCWSTWSNNTGSAMYSWFVANSSHSSHSGSCCIESANLTGAIDTTQDWLMMPPIEVPSTISLNLYFYVCFRGNLYHDCPGLTIVASTQGRGNRAFFTDTLYFEQNHTGDIRTSDYVLRSVSLEAYMGQTVWIAFVHGNKAINLALDDISIVNGAEWRTVTVFSADTALGTVTGGGIYHDSSWVTIAAQPMEPSADGRYARFVGWSDGDSNNPRRVFVVSDTTFTAFFEERQYQIEVVANDSTRGSVAGGGLYYFGDTVTLTATPYEGYRFVEWSDGDTSNPRTVIVIADATYTALFEPVVGINGVGDAPYKVYVRQGRVIVEGVENERVQIFDLMGRRRSTDECLPRGIYLVRIDNAFSKRIVVM